MLHREVNPLEQRHLALSTRFKAAWAFHQLLMGMQRMGTGGDFENRAERFQSLFNRLKGFSESLHGVSAGTDQESTAQIMGLEREVDQLFEELIRQESEIAPSELRRFLTQVKTLDDRILIEVVRFYLGIHDDEVWPQDRLDKVDFLISRLAERIAGPALQADEMRLEKVLKGLLASAADPKVTDQQVEGLTGTLQDLRSEVRWVKTFGELNDSRLVEIYRALKHDMSGRMFHPRILPLVVEVNNAFRRKIEELRSHEETRLIDEYQQLSQLQERASPPAGELQSELADLQRQIDQFREGAKSNNVRLGELVVLGNSLREVTSRLQSHVVVPTESSKIELPAPDWSGGGSNGRAGLVPDLECLQPQWSHLLTALSGAGDEISVEVAANDSALAMFRLEKREIEAFQRTVGAEPANVGLEQFILAAASLRYRILQDVEALQGSETEIGSGESGGRMHRARETARLADAYIKHFAHLIDQALVDGEGVEARRYLRLKTRLLREWSGLMNLVLQESGGLSLAGGTRSSSDASGEDPFRASKLSAGSLPDLGES